MSEWESIQIQSRQRIGRSDFGINPIRVEKMYYCIYQALKNEGYFEEFTKSFDGVCKFKED